MRDVMEPRWRGTDRASFGNI